MNDIRISNAVRNYYLIILANKNKFVYKDKRYFLIGPNGGSTPFDCYCDVCEFNRKWIIK